jgi:hypothetical protein
MRSDICIGQNFFGAIFTHVIYNLFFGKIKAQYTKISMLQLRFKTIGRFSGFKFEDFLELDYMSRNYMRWKIIWVEIIWAKIIWNACTYMSRNYMKCYWAN